MATQSPLALNTPVQRKPDLMIATIDNEVVMLDARQGKYFGIQGSGTRIWELLAEPVSAADIAETLHRESDADRDTCQRDTLEFLEELNKLELITINP